MGSSRPSSRKKRCLWEQDCFRNRKCKKLTKSHYHLQSKIHYTTNFWVIIRCFIALLKPDTKSTSWYTKGRSTNPKNLENLKLKVLQSQQASRHYRCLNRHLEYNKLSLYTSFQQSRPANPSIQIATWTRLPKLMQASIQNTQTMKRRNGLPIANCSKCKSSLFQMTRKKTCQVWIMKLTKYNQSIWKTLKYSIKRQR